jgi:mannan endo-1,4-beta-mannosidase
MTRRLLIGGAAAGATTLALDAAPAVAAPPDAASRHGSPVSPASPGFVTVGHGGFAVHGSPFRFGGTNCYYLHQQSHYMIDAVLGDAARMGLTVVRAWAFADGTGGGYRPLQTEPYTYDEAAFEPLDYAVHRAGRLGLRLVLPLVNRTRPVADPPGAS